ncbi:hypothetical protein KKD80_01400, partial [Patescibacteria group bacterium]|nr:hypothetical protein [Patescibacteria group bacterium]
FSFTALVRSCGINTPHVPSKREIAAELKTDPAFKAAVKGNDGKSAVAPTAAEVATALKADAEFAKSVAAAKSAEPTATTTTPAPEAQTATAPPTTEQEQTRRPPRREPARQPTFVNYEGGGLRVQYRLGDFAGQLEEVERRLVRMNSRR